MKGKKKQNLSHFSTNQTLQKMQDDRSAQKEKAIQLITEKLASEIKNKEKELAIMEQFIKDEQLKRKLLLDFSKCKSFHKTHFFRQK